jgi:hypothetical protein
MLEQKVKDARRQGCRVLVGTNANAIIGAPLPHDSKHIIANWGLSERSERGHGSAAWLHLIKLAATNTMFRKPLCKQWTQEMYSTGNKRQIDYILADSSLRRRFWDAEVFDGFGLLQIRSSRCVSLY